MQGPQYFHFNMGAWFLSLSLLLMMRQLINNRLFVVAVQSHTGIVLIVAKNRVINSCVSLVDCWLMESIIICLQRVWCNRGSVMVVIHHCLRTRDYFNKRNWSIDQHCLIFDHLIVAKGERTQVPFCSFVKIVSASLKCKDLIGTHFISVLSLEGNRKLINWLTVLVMEGNYRQKSVLKCSWLDKTPCPKNYD